MASSVEANQAGGSAAGGGRVAAAMVAAGILLSRIAGLIRDRVFAHYFGNSDAADAFRAAFRIPNFLQNLFGEGVLSASFIPVYARLRAEQQDEQAGKLAEAIFALLFVATTVLVALGIFATPSLIDAIAPGFHGEKRAAHDSPGAHTVSRRRPAGVQRLVPGNSQQPSPFFSFLHGAGDLERDFDCGAGLARRACLHVEAGRDSGLGVGRGQRPCSSRCNCRRYFGFCGLCACG